MLVWGLWIGQALSEGGTSWVRAFWETGVATVVLLIVGEVVPKSVANQKRVTVSQRMASVIATGMKISRPLAHSLMVTSRALSRNGSGSNNVTVAQLEEALELTD